MNCIIVDDEPPLGRKGNPVVDTGYAGVVFVWKFRRCRVCPVSLCRRVRWTLVFLDIKMPGGERTGVCPDDPVGYACHLCDGLCRVCPRQL